MANDDKAKGEVLYDPAAGTAETSEIIPETGEAYATGQAKAKTQEAAEKMKQQGVFARRYGTEADIPEDFKGKPGEFPSNVMWPAELTTGLMGAPGIIRGVMNPATRAAVLRSLAGAIGLGAGGRYVGGGIGSMFGPEGKEIGEAAGGTIGGLAGGVMGAKGMKVPAGRFGFIESLLGAEPEVDPVAQAIREGRAARIPTRMPKPPAAPKEVDELTQAVREGRASKLPTRMPKLKVENVPEPSRFEGMTSSASAGKAEPGALGTGGEKPKIEMVSQFEKPPKMQTEPSRIIKPGEEGKMRVEGSYWSFKEPDLRRAVLGGDRDAAVVYRQRFGQLPEGAGLLTDIGTGKMSGLYRSGRK